MKKSSGHRLLFGDDDYVTTLGEQEAEFMGSITDRAGGIGISRVSVAGKNEVRYLTGPLMRIGHLVKKVDLHRRIAADNPQNLPGSPAPERKPMGTVHCIQPSRILALMYGPPSDTFTHSL